jgi:flagellar motor switch protein FliN/FliY
MADQDAPSSDATKSDPSSQNADEPADATASTAGQDEPSSPESEDAADSSTDVDGDHADQSAEGRNVDLPNFQQVLADVEASGLNLLQDVELHVKIELGRTQMFVEDVLRLAEGSVVELDKLAGDPVDIYVNERLVARGEVLVLNDNFCVRVSEIVGGDGDSEDEEQETDVGEAPPAVEAGAEQPAAAGSAT